MDLDKTLDMLKNNRITTTIYNKIKNGQRRWCVKCKGDVKIKE